MSAQRGVSRLQYVRFPRQGTFPVRVKLFHADLVGDGAWSDAWVEVDESGNTRIRKIETESPGDAFEGRLIELNQQ